MIFLKTYKVRGCATVPKRHGIALVTARELCESALGGEFEITRPTVDGENYFTTTVTLKDLARASTQSITRAGIVIDIFM